MGVTSEVLDEVLNTPPLQLLVYYDSSTKTLRKTIFQNS